MGKAHRSTMSTQGPPRVTPNSTAPAPGRNKTTMATLAMISFLFFVGIQTRPAEAAAINEVPSPFDTALSISSSSLSPEPYQEDTTDLRWLQQDITTSCFEDEVMTCKYNEEPSVLAHPGMMFNVASRDKPVKILAMEIDIRLDLLGPGDALDALGVEIFACTECPQDEDFFRGFYYVNERNWKLVADVNLIRHPTDVTRWLVPAHAFSAITMGKQERRPLYIRTKNGSEWLDNTIDVFVKSGDMTSGVTSGSSNLSLFAGYATKSVGPWESTDENDDGIDRTVAPVFAGLFYLEAETNFCGFEATLEATIEFEHVMSTIPDGLDLTELDQEVDTEFVPAMLQDDALLVEYTKKYDLEQDKDKPSRAFFRPFDGSCPEDFENCQTHVIRIFLKHKESLPQRILRAQVTKHTQYATQLLQRYFDESGGSSVRLYNAGYRAAQAQFQITFTSSKNDLTSMDETQQVFLRDQMTSYLRSTLPNSFATIYETKIEDQGGRRRRALLRQGQQEQSRNLQASSRLTVSGYFQGGHFALEEEAEYGIRIREALMARVELGEEKAFLETLKFEVNLPGRDMELNDRHLLFANIDDLDVSINDFAIPIVWVEGREREDELAGSDDDSGMNTMMIVIIVAVLVVLLLIGLGIARIVQLRYEKKQEEQKQKEKAEGVDDHSDYFCNNYNADYMNEMEAKTKKYQEKRKADKEKLAMPSVTEGEDDVGENSPVSSSGGIVQQQENIVDPSESTVGGNSALPSYPRDDVNSMVSPLKESRPPMYQSPSKRKKFSRDTTSQGDAESGLIPRTFQQGEESSVPPIGVVVVSSEEFAPEAGEDKMSSNKAPVRGRSSVSPRRAKSSEILPYRQPADRGTPNAKATVSPRRAKSSEILPYPKPAERGKSNSRAAVSPRRAKSSEILPYPKPAERGKSNSRAAVSPRRAKSSEILPYPKPAERGKSNSSAAVSPRRAKSSEVAPYSKPASRGRSPRRAQTSETHDANGQRDGLFRTKSEANNINHVPEGRKRSNSSDRVLHASAKSKNAHDLWKDEESDSSSVSSSSSDGFYSSKAKGSSVAEPSLGDHIKSEPPPKNSSAASVPWSSKFKKNKSSESTSPDGKKNTGPSLSSLIGKFSKKEKKGSSSMSVPDMTSPKTPSRAKSFGEVFRKKEKKGSSSTSVPDMTSPKTPSRAKSFGEVFGKKEKKGSSSMSVPDMTSPKTPSRAKSFGEVLGKNQTDQTADLDGKQRFELRRQASKDGLVVNNHGEVQTPTSGRRVIRRSNSSDKVLHASVKAKTAKDLWNDDFFSSDSDSASDSSSVSSSSSDGFYSSKQKTSSGAAPSLDDHVKSKPTQKNSSAASVPWSSKYKNSNSSVSSKQSKGKSSKSKGSHIKNSSSYKKPPSRAKSMGDDLDGKKRFELRQQESKEEKTQDPLARKFSRSNSSDKVLHASVKAKTAKDLWDEDGASSDSDSSSVSSSSSDGFYSSKAKASVGPAPSLNDHIKSKQVPNNSSASSVPYAKDSKSSKSKNKDAPSLGSHISTSSKKTKKGSSSMSVPDAAYKPSKSRESSSKKAPSRTKSFDGLYPNKQTDDKHGNKISVRDGTLRSDMRRSISTGGLKKNRYIIDENQVMQDGLGF